jgi:hypothetical protein
MVSLFFLNNRSDGALIEPAVRHRAAEAASVPKPGETAVWCGAAD